MELSDSLSFLSFLIIILIAAIVSPKAKEFIRKIVDFVISILKWLVILVFETLIIFLICFLVYLGWNKLHEIFPEMWSLGEFMVIGVIGVLCFCGNKSIEHLNKYYNINNNVKLQKLIEREFCVLTSILALGMTIIFVNTLINNSVTVRNVYFLGMFILIFGYPFYLLIKLFPVIRKVYLTRDFKGSFNNFIQNKLRKYELLRLEDVQENP